MVTLDEIDAMSLLDQTHLLLDGLVALATGKSFDDGNQIYRAVRATYRKNDELFLRAPDIVRTCLTADQFWSAIQTRFPTYKERREFLWTAFAPLIDYLETDTQTASSAAVGEALLQLCSEGVQRAWEKALARRTADPEGAITAARTLIESVCKHVLDDCNVIYFATDDLPRLWYLAAEALNLAPSQHEAKLFRTILGSCQTIVGGLGELRNQVGDAHGHGRRPVRPKARHAELAVNLAGTMSAFLVATWMDRGHASLTTAQLDD